MGSFCASKPAVSNTSQTQTYSPNPQIGNAGTQALNMAQGAASQPFQMPAAPVAGFNPFQTQAFGQYQDIQGMTDPYFQNARGQEEAGGTPVTQGDISKYMNPYADAAMASMKKYIFDPQRVQTMGSATQAAGGVGADRLALTSQNLDKTQADALAGAQAGFYGQAFQSAEEQKRMALQSAQGWAGLGQSAQGANLQATGALAGAGAQQQQQTQREQMSPYQQRLAELAYPFQTAQFLAGVTGGLAPAFGGTTSGYGTTTQMPAQPSPFSQIMGGITSGMGIAGLVGTGMGATQGGDAGWPAGPSNAPSYPNPYGGSWYGNRGGVVGYADGGEVEGEEQNSLPYPTGGEYAGLIPHMPLPMGGGQNTGAHLDLSPKIADPPKDDKKGGGGGGMGDMAKMAMMFMERGGSVNPWDFAQSFAPGGDVEEVDPEDFNRIDAGVDDHSRPIERPAPNLGMWPFNKGQADYKGDVTMYPPSTNSYDPMTGGPARAVGKWMGIGNPASAAPAADAKAASQMPLPPDFTGNPTGIPPGAGTQPTPGAYPRPLPGAIPPTMPPPTAVAQAQPSDRTGGYRSRPGGLNSDMTISDFQMPKDQNPYPDALHRDWGQKAARSPWLSLIEGGARMMQTVGPPGVSIGAGLQAGVGTLSRQRTELRSEQQINQKADELYRHAKSELNKYTRKTPHELATEQYHNAALAKMRYQPVNMEIDDGKGGTKVISAGFDPQRNQYIDSTTGQPVSGKLIARQTGSESATSRAARAMTSAKDDPDYASNQLGTINRWRVRNGLPPQGAMSLPSDKSQLIKDQSYETAKGPAVWDGEKFVAP